jgi:hypothetical protein
MKEGNSMTKSRERVAVFLFGVIFIVTLLVLAIKFPEPTAYQYQVFEVVLGLAAAGVAGMIPGFLEVTVPTWIKAGGALAVFVLVMYKSPARLAVQRPPLMPLHSSGTWSAKVQVYPESFRRRAHIAVLAVARTPTDGGCMQIEILGVGEKCKGEQAYRNPGGSEELRSSLECVRTVEAGTSPEIIASAPNGGFLGCPGTFAVSVDLSVNFYRE